MTALDRLLDRLFNGLGEPLASDARARIVDLDANPSPQTWNEAYSLIVGSQLNTKSLCAAVRDVDPRCPRAPSSAYARTNPDRWHGYFPAQLTLRIALRHAGDVDTDSINHAGTKARSSLTPRPPSV